MKKKKKLPMVCYESILISLLNVLYNFRFEKIVFKKFEVG